jgi:hypothetical protein
MEQTSISAPVAVISLGVLAVVAYIGIMSVIYGVQPKEIVDAAENVVKYSANQIGKLNDSKQLKEERELKLKRITSISKNDLDMSLHSNQRLALIREVFILINEEEISQNNAGYSDGYLNEIMKKIEESFKSQEDRIRGLMLSNKSLSEENDELKRQLKELKK